MRLGIVPNGGAVVHAGYRSASGLRLARAVCGGAPLQMVEASLLPPCRSCVRILAKRGLPFPEGVTSDHHE